ncbi:MAG: DICT sensory domain-containing protein [Synechococcus sp.]
MASPLHPNISDRKSHVSVEAAKLPRKHSSRPESSSPHRAPHRTSLLVDLLAACPQVRPQVYFKSSLVALSHALEDLVLSEAGDALVFANFQRERFYRQEAARYLRIHDVAARVYVLAAPETDFHAEDVPYERVALDLNDPLANEWHLIIVDRHYAGCLICAEKPRTEALRPGEGMDAMRQFEGYWSFEPEVAISSAQLLLPKIAAYRPDLAEQLAIHSDQLEEIHGQLKDALHRRDPFSERLMTYLQAGQYKLQRAYRAISRKEERERLINTIVMAIRRSLDSEEIFDLTVRELGVGLGACRCLLYSCREGQTTIEISSEFVRQGISSLLGQTIAVSDNPLLAEALQSEDAAQLSDVPLNTLHPSLQTVWKQWGVSACLVVPIVYQGRLLGAIELHRCVSEAEGHKTRLGWVDADVELVKTVAVQIGVALIQAEAYENLTQLNQQLEELDSAKSDLIAVTGHELRTPLSTIQVCLESLASEPDMEPEIRQVMLDTAIHDAERLRTLVQDFLTLSRLESGRVDWHVEALPPQECVDLALSSFARQDDAFDIQVEVSEQLPLVSADGEWLVEVLRKLLSNARKFTPSNGHVTVEVDVQGNDEVMFSVADTGRGIESDRLQQIFERFYQAERSLRRTVGGTGLGLAICRQIVEAMGGRIWAESEGPDLGSTFRFTVPIAA